jgi:hypothetical protein
MRGPALTVVCILIFALVAPGAVAAQPGAAAQRAALTWLRDQLQADGSFPGFGPGDTADALMAFVAASEPLPRARQGGVAPVEYLEAQAPTYAPTSVGAAAKLALAAVAVNADPTSFGGVNLLDQIGQSYDPATGQYGADVYGHALALLAIKAVGAEPPAAAIEQLLDRQLDDGGWSFDGTTETGSDTNTTSLAVQALADDGSAAATRRRALDYLKSQQNDDGGFPYSQASAFGNASDANSTAAVIQALRAVNQRPDAADWQPAGASPLALLTSLQNASGAFRYQASLPDDNPLATYQAIPALFQQSLPVRTAAIAGAQALVAPGTAVAPTLPATGTLPALPLALPAFAALALLIGGAWLRRNGAPR